MIPFVSFAVLAMMVAPAQAQSSPQRDTLRLTDIVVSASRTKLAASLRGSAADRLTASFLSARGVDRLEQALRLTLGSGIVQSGAPGGVTSTFLRGTNSNHTLLLVDGIRVSDANLPPGALLGGFELGHGDQVEVVRGPQSTLYGGAAVGGVIAISNEGPASDGWRARITAGSFSTYRAKVGGSASVGRLTVRGSVSASDARNERPANDWDQRTEAAGASYRVGDRLTIGATFRGLQQSYQSPGDLRSTNSTPVTVSDFDSHLATAFVDARLVARWSSRVTVGRQSYFLRGRSRYNGGPESASVLAADRWTLEWQHRVQPTTAVEGAFGVSGEWTDVGDGSEQRTERLGAGYAELGWSPVKGMVVSAGARADDYSTFTSAVTGRVGAAYLVAAAGVKVRATLGSGFLPPSLTARYGSAFQAANPEIKPERSRGWDLGADWYLAGGRGVIDITLFENRLRDLIGFEPAEFPALGRNVNIARARTRGVEVGGRLVMERVELRAGYGYLDAKALGEPNRDLARLIRRPAHSLFADALWRPTDRIQFGSTVVTALDREDTDFNTFPFVRVNPGDYLDARLHASASLTRRLAIRASVDNIFGRRYEEVYGFPALGRRLGLGIELDH